MENRESCVRPEAQISHPCEAPLRPNYSQRLSNLKGEKMEIKVIYDEVRAIREKVEIDAHNKNLYRPARIIGYLTLVLIAVSLVIVYFSSANLISSVWGGLATVVTVSFAISWFIVTHSKGGGELRYPANVQYYIGTHGKAIVEHKIIPESRYGGPYLEVLIKNKKGKEKNVEIPLSRWTATKNISEDIIDLIDGVEGCGRWYMPYDRKRQELDRWSIEADEIRRRNREGLWNDCPACRWFGRSIKGICPKCGTNMRELECNNQNEGEEGV